MFIPRYQPIKDIVGNREDALRIPANIHTSSITSNLVYWQGVHLTPKSCGAAQSTSSEVYQIGNFKKSFRRQVERFRGCSVFRS